MVFLSLAYLQWRLVCRRLLDPTLVGETVADMIRLLRHEHLVSLITAVAKAAKTRLRVQMVVKRFLPPVATASE